MKPHGRATLATQEEDELDKDFFEAIARDAQVRGDELDKGFFEAISGDVQVSAYTCSRSSKVCVTEQLLKGTSAEAGG